MEGAFLFRFKAAVAMEFGYWMYKKGADPALGIFFFFLSSSRFNQIFTMVSRIVKFGRFFLDHQWSTALFAGGLTYYIYKYAIRFLSVNPELARIRVTN